jgi:hypothetical protein
MLDLKMNELCTQISVEKDPKRLMELVEELILHLGKKQNDREFKFEKREELPNANLGPFA